MIQWSQIKFLSRADFLGFPEQIRTMGADESVNSSSLKRFSCVRYSGEDDVFDCEQTCFLTQHISNLSTVKLRNGTFSLAGTAARAVLRALESALTE